MTGLEAYPVRNASNDFERRRTDVRAALVVNPLVPPLARELGPDPQNAASKQHDVQTRSTAANRASPRTPASRKIRRRRTPPTAESRAAAVTQQGRGRAANAAKLRRRLGPFQRQRHGTRHRKIVRLPDFGKPPPAVRARKFFAGPGPRGRARDLRPQGRHPSEATRGYRLRHGPEIRQHPPSSFGEDPPALHLTWTKTAPHNKRASKRRGNFSSAGGLGFADPPEILASDEKTRPGQAEGSRWRSTSPGCVAGAEIKAQIWYKCVTHEVNHSLEGSAGARKLGSVLMCRTWFRRVRAEKEPKPRTRN